MKQTIAREASRDRVQPNMSGIGFAEIPEQSELFLAYLSDPVALKRFYPNVLASPGQVTKFIPTVLESYRTDRSRLCDALERSNHAIAAGPETFANIDLLRKQDTVAVVTGQQAGLFSGPLYTIFKALSAIRLAEQLNEEGKPAVPIFWMATEDHDFEEVSSTDFISRSGEIYKAEYMPAGYTEGLPVGVVKIGESVSQVLDRLFDTLPSTEFSREVREILENAWRAGGTFGSAFGMTMVSLLSKFGLVCIDPLDVDIKELAAPIYSRAIDRADEIVGALQERNEEIAASGFHAQVLIEEGYFPLFCHDDNGRRIGLRTSGPGKFRSKGNGLEFSIDELRSMAADRPRDLSPGVMLRPAVQDFLLPSVAYFGGGAEVAYFAQNSVVYQVLGRPATPIFHRQSFTVVEASCHRTMEKFGLSFTDLFDGPDKAVMHQAARNADPHLAGAFASAEETINTELSRIDRYLAALDPTLLDNVSKRRRKMLYHIAAIRKKALLAAMRKNGDAERQITALFTSLMPHGRLQERSLNVFSFLNKYGPNFIDWLYDAVDLNDKRHRILYLR